MNKLRACPFCKSDKDLLCLKLLPTTNITGENVYGDKQWKCVLCRRCGAQGPMAKDIDEVKKLWGYTRRTT